MRFLRNLSDRPNAVNLAVVLALMLFVLACACPGGKWEFGNQNSSTPSNSKPESNKTESDEDSKAPTKGRKDKGDFVVEDGQVSDPKYDDLDRSIKKERVLEDAAKRLNSALILPRDITLRASDCDGVINAFFQPDDNSITICYPLMETFFVTFRNEGYSNDEASKKMSDAITWVFLHEVGHALIANYELPTTGGEEDVADRLSTYVNLRELGEDGVNSVIAGAEAFFYMSKRQKRDGREMADEHLLGEQRFYNSMCLLFGSDPDKYSDVVRKGLLPKERAVRCPSEFQKNEEAWGKLLAEWRKDQ